MKKLICGILIVLMASLNAYATPGTDDWDKDVPATTQYIDEGGISILGSLTAVDRVLAKYQQGCSIIYASTSTFLVDIGEVTLSNAAGTTRVFTQNTSQVTVTWADIDAGSEAASTTYYVYAISTSDATNTFTVSISASSTTPTGATYWKRLGNFYNDSGSDISLIVNEAGVSGIVIHTGTVAHAGTIPLPTGYTADQCEWFAYLDDFSTSKWYGYYKHDVRANSSRVVTAQIMTHNWVNGGHDYTTNATAGYVIIGTK